MALVQPSSNRLWQKWVGYMTEGAHGIQQAAIVREDGCVLAASHGLTISRREILELPKYFRSHAVSRCHSLDEGRGEGYDQGENQVKFMFCGLHFKSRRRTSTSSNSSCDSHEGHQGQCEEGHDQCSNTIDIRQQQQEQERHLLTICLQGRVYFVRSRSQDHVLAFCGPTNVIIVRSKHLYLIGLCPSRQVVSEASEFLDELKTDLAGGGY